MLNLIDLRGPALPAAEAELRALLPRAELDVTAAVARVRPIVEAVRDRGGYSAAARPLTCGDKHWPRGDAA